MSNIDRFIRIVVVVVVVDRWMVSLTCQLIALVPPNPQSSEEAVAAINDAEQQLEMLKRQVVLGQMYPSARSVME